MKKKIKKQTKKKIKKIANSLEHKLYFLVTVLIFLVLLLVFILFVFCPEGRNKNKFLKSQDTSQVPIQLHEQPRLIFQDNSQTSSQVQAQQSPSEISTPTCPREVKIEEVRGNSLDPYIKSGESIKVLFGYYDCNPVARNDVVVYNFSGNELPIIKFVKALPGDTWSLKEAGDYYQIIVNNKILTNSLGQKYQIEKKKAAMLKLYARSYPQIPSDSYLLLGNLIDGSLDSTKFGLAAGSNIMGKVEKISALNNR